MNVAVEYRVLNLTFEPASGAARNVVPVPAATVSVLAEVLFVLMIVNWVPFVQDPPVVVRVIEDDVPETLTIFPSMAFVSEAAASGIAWLTTFPDTEMLPATETLLLEVIPEAAVNSPATDAAPDTAALPEIDTLFAAVSSPATDAAPDTAALPVTDMLDAAVNNPATEAAPVTESMSST